MITFVLLLGLIRCMAINLGGLLSFTLHSFLENYKFSPDLSLITFLVFVPERVVQRIYSSQYSNPMPGRLSNSHGRLPDTNLSPDYRIKQNK